jgi:hypothetical protein
MKTKGKAFEKFFWQRGYAAFSVYPANIQIVIDYILNQEVHHKNKNFEDEYRSFLKECELDYDEKYVWD